jgi:sugar phosphate isomerase/epimerase
MHRFKRRHFLATMMGIPAISIANKSEAAIHRPPNKHRLKISLNAFSFNDPLLKGSMSVFDMLEFCAATGFDAVDITGYYIKGYPEVPDDEYLFSIKRKAFDLGLEISGTGVRNDFTLADKAKRNEEVERVKKWVEVAAKIGAPVIRIFAGNQKNENISKETVTTWMLEDIRTCVDYGRQHGVVIGLQNHNDFIQTAGQVIDMIKAVDSEWLGLILDTGSYRVHDPYEEIEKSIPCTVNWQVKEKIFVKGKEVPTDLERLVKIIKSSDYKGYLPIETLGEGDPKTKIVTLYNSLKKAVDGE